MIKILQKEDQKLREISKEVPKKDIKNLKLKKIILSMKKALYSQDDGVAIAAPQIGHSLRIFMISKKVFNITKKYPSLKDDLVFINPKIIKTSKEKEEMEEGCLSVRFLYGNVLRNKKVTVKALDETGKEFIMGGSGLLAQIFQHEIDHLDGVLFIDKADKLEEVLPESKIESKNKK